MLGRLPDYSFDRVSQSLPYAISKIVPDIIQKKKIVPDIAQSFFLGGSLSLAPEMSS